MSGGKITASIGEKLTEKLKRDYDVFFDHGDATKGNNVRACLALLSDEPKNATRVADVDIVICSKREVQPMVKAIVEVEESGFSPKKILGDVMSLMLVKAIAIRKDDGSHGIYKLNNRTVRYVFGVVKSKGSKTEQIEEHLLPQLRDVLNQELLDQLPIVKVLNEHDDLEKEVIKEIVSNL